MKNLLVTIDFNNSEQKLVKMAYNLAKSYSSKVWLLHVTAPDPDFVGYEVGPQYIRDFRAEELKNEHKALQVLADDLENKGVNAEGILIQGATLEIILKEADHLNIDLIIVGYEDHNFLYEALVGSVSSKLIKKTKIPVLVVPIDEEE
ncbi:universal stress protein [Winogradskyella sp. DF17]|uniref:Universal stress protein n=1 Tax=Winogradskyella pelagia TaxID=2819984 RepID=A0ABS3SYE0_9FLAO|nr:universal stress protein [Winogradskyella sp. DF17]MBO3115508.1 universal stress protein [Winogradskyella sp. DF17]